MTSPLRFLGVDGGGTKTRFVLIDGAGETLAEAQLGTTYHPQIGLDGVRAVLEQGVGDVLAQAGLGADALTHAFFGLPGYGEDSRVAPRLDAVPRGILTHGRYHCGNDMVCGWAGSLACADGINIVAGTGSIGYGQRAGREARAGGWGDVFSDEGSAHWIAVQGLNAYSRMSDGRAPIGPLHAIINRTLRLAHDLDICALVYGEGAWSRGKVAQLSPVVAQAAAEGDEAAQRIFVLAGRELADIVAAVFGRLGFPDEPVPVSYSGGAFSAGALLLTPFAEALAGKSPDFELRTPRHPPHLGAALYAADLSGHRIAA